VLASGRVRACLALLVLAFCGYGLDRDWPATSAALRHLHWYVLPLSLIAAMAGAWCTMLAWRAILADLGSPLPVRATARICFVGQLGKYVPGAVWAFAAQMELGHDRGVPRRRGITSIVVSLAVTVVTGLVIAAATLPFASGRTLPRYWWMLLAVPVLVVILSPPVLGRLLDRALVLARQAPLEHWLSWGGLLRACAWNVGGWALLGTQVWLLLSGLTAGPAAALVPAALGGYALAFSAGLLIVVLPGGIGAREVILIAALTPVATHGAAIAVALTARLVSTVSDLVCGALGLALGRSRSRGLGRSRGRHAASRPAPARLESGSVPRRG
jgi:glycosyltransferase 2 family protein